MANHFANGKEETLQRIEIERIEINAAYDHGPINDMSDSDSITVTSNKNHNNSSSISSYSNSPNTNSNNNNNNNNNNRGTIKSDSKDLQDRTDRYGFIHDKKLPPELTEIEQKRNNIEKLREKKWIAMLKDWKSFTSKYSEKLESRVFKGIPNSMRNRAWFQFLDIESQIKAQTGVYEKMKNLARAYSLDLRQIDLDINRTFRNNSAYRKRYCQRQVQLYNILAAYSIYNTEIGYCQGMSTVTALLLMYLSDEEKTFWALSQLMSNSKYSMHGFFKRDFPKLIRYTDKHDMIIKTLLPKVHKKFIKCNITSLLYTTKWFLQCYLEALPFSLVLRFWDVYLLKGDIAMLAMSYCILRMHKKRLLLKEYDMDKINEFINHQITDDFLFSDDVVIEKLETCIDQISRYKFPNGPLIETIPQIELPKIPFGDFKKFDKQEILSQIVQKSTEKSSAKDRDMMVEQMAKDRLEIEKKQREERRRKKREEMLRNNGGGGLDDDNPPDSFGRFINDGGKPIPNISDDEDDEDYDNEDDDDDDEDDEEDDLNPSKLSEYDDDKVDKESMLSNMTRQSSPQRSFTDIHSQVSSHDNQHHSHTNHLHHQQKNSSNSNNSSLKKSNLISIKQSQSNSSFVHQTSEYENLVNSSSKLSVNQQHQQNSNDGRRTPTLNGAIKSVKSSNDDNFSNLQQQSSSTTATPTTSPGTSGLGLATGSATATPQKSFVSTVFNSVSDTATINSTTKSTVLNENNTGNNIANSPKSIFTQVNNLNLLNPSQQKLSPHRTINNTILSNDNRIGSLSSESLLIQHHNHHHHYHHQQQQQQQLQQQQQQQYTSPSLSPSSPSSSSAGTGTVHKTSIPSSHSYVTTASIKSNPPPISPSSFLSLPQSTSSNHVTSITTNPNYYINSNQINTNNVSKIVTSTNYEYVRSPHGIYTRVNVIPFSNQQTPSTNTNNKILSDNFNIINDNSNSSNNNNNKINNNIINNNNINSLYNKSPPLKIGQNISTFSQIPQSSSTYLISNGKPTPPTNTSGSYSTGSTNLLPISTTPTTTNSNNNNKRTSSLRTNQKHQTQLMNSNSSSKLNNHGNSSSTIINSNNNNNNTISANPTSSNFMRINTPTKQQLQNHSLRIANIQQQQQHQLNGFINSTINNSTSNSSSNSHHYPTISIIAQVPKHPIHQQQQLQQHQQSPPPMPQQQQIIQPIQPIQQQQQQYVTSSQQSQLNYQIPLSFHRNSSIVRSQQDQQQQQLHHNHSHNHHNNHHHQHHHHNNLDLNRHQNDNRIKGTNKLDDDDLIEQYDYI